MTAAGRRTAAVALAALLPALVAGPSGCRIGVSPQVEYRGEREPRVVQAEREPNGLRAGLARLQVSSLSGGGADPEGGNPELLGALLAQGVRDLGLFAEIRYPWTDQEVDVVLEPFLAVGLSKNRASNFLTVLPGLVLPWVDGFGFDYDHEAVLFLRVRNPKRPDVVCDLFSAETRMIAERYPSALWWLGLHAGLFVLAVTEAASTDAMVLEQLALRNSAIVYQDALRWIAMEFRPAVRPCPLHADAPISEGQRYCIYCRRDLWFPILERTGGEDPSLDDAR